MLGSHCLVWFAGVELNLTKSEFFTETLLVLILIHTGETDMGCVSMVTPEIFHERCHTRPLKTMGWHIPKPKPITEFQEFCCAVAVYKLVQNKYGTGNRPTQD